MIKVYTEVGLGIVQELEELSCFLLIAAAERDTTIQLLPNHGQIVFT